MIPAGAKAVAIPEGTVRKIECAGKVLWEKPWELPCDPVLSIAYARKAPYGSTWVEVTLTVTGIAESLISKVAGYLQGYSESQGEYISIIPVSSWKKTVQDETTFVYVGWIMRLYDPATMTQPRILTELTYTNPEGNSRILSEAVEYV